MRPPASPSLSRHPRWGLRIAAATAALVLGVSGVGHAVVTTLDDGVQRVDAFDGLDSRPDPGRGLNLLLIGDDTRDGITEEERRAFHLGGSPCNCADTLMLVHLSEARDRAAVVSLPRDTYTEPAGAPAKLNTVLSRGGPQQLVGTVEEMTGVRIDHYLEVNFVSFMRGVDEVGGVDVCTVKPLKDDRSGLDLPPGISTLNGGQALQYVRARSLDGTADFGRMQRQQRFLASFIDKVTGGDVLLSPARLNRTAEALLDSVRADPGFGTAELIELAGALNGISPSSVEFTSVPIDTIGRPLPDGGSAVTWDEAAAGRLFTALREDRPLVPRPVPPADGAEAGTDGPQGEPQHRAVPVDVPPEEIRVQVENAAGREGLGAEVDAALRASGFATTGAPRDADDTAQSRSTITHGPDRKASAAALRTAVPGAQLREAEGHGPELLLSVGQDFGQVQRVRDAARPMRAEEWEGGGYAAATGDQITCA
ncbi:LCP family protein [Streptomyces sp. ACA25]|uniref:LCP family protein n=1 Tax=Streptomyces sp. ACA25 TaxID=3022596 RepID=UPI002307DA43|nr:LCP family protein [Streptomyces sp. ACA25]MDB1087165.1 LCP family protein [Streptomyces sp. ACA25]